MKKILVVTVVMVMAFIASCSDDGGSNSQVNNTNNTTNNTNNVNCDESKIGTVGCQCSATGLCFGDLVCNIDTNVCEEPFVPVCGNGAIETGEVCDGSVLPTNWTCLDEGFDGGTLGCNTDCLSLDTSLCTFEIPECIEPELVCGNDCYEPVVHEVDDQGNEEEFKYMKYECCENSVAMVAHYNRTNSTHDANPKNCGGCGIDCGQHECVCPGLEFEGSTSIENPCVCSEY